MVRVGRWDWIVRGVGLNRALVRSSSAFGNSNIVSHVTSTCAWYSSLDGAVSRLRLGRIEPWPSLSSASYIPSF